MPSKPEALDYEGVFPIRRRHVQERDAQAEAWPSAAKDNSFDEGELTSSTTQRVTPSTNRAAIGMSSALTTDAFEVLTRRGHSLSFFWLFLFSVVLYVRPYEFFPGLSSLT